MTTYEPSPMLSVVDKFGNLTGGPNFHRWMPTRSCGYCIHLKRDGSRMVCERGAAQGELRKGEEFLADCDWFEHTKEIG